MKREKINKILMNIVTAALGLGVIVFGYFSFINKESVSKDSVADVANMAIQTTSIGADIDNTVSSLKDLSRAVALSTVIFELPAFRSLENFTVPVPAEKEGRDNPFTPTEWKLRIKASEAALKSGVVTPAVQDTPGPVTVVANKQTQTKTDSLSDLFGEFAPGI